MASSTLVTMKLLLTLSLTLAVACCSMSCSTTIAAKSHVLFSGDAAQLANWSMAGPGEFVHDGDTIYAQGGMGLYWYTAKEFVDFELELEWKVTAESNNSGVFVRFPNPGLDPWVAVNEGYELQVCDTGGAKHDTGSVYSFQAATHIPTKAVGEWNSYRIRVVGQAYSLFVNGELVNNYTGDRSTQGYIGLQNHDNASPVRYRNIRVTEV
ncbi:MAG: hypothetical protein ACI84O_000317 [Myxococcota bacterium]|jgi:hypothetical protein